MIYEMSVTRYTLVELVACLAEWIRRTPNVVIISMHTTSSIQHLLGDESPCEVNYKAVIRYTIKEGRK